MVEDEYIKNLNKFRKYLIEKTEFFQEKAKDKNASPCGEHYRRGNANGLIIARAELEEIFNIWD